MPKIPDISPAGQMSPQAPNFRPATADQYGAQSAEALKQLGANFGSALDTIGKAIGENYQSAQGDAAVADANKQLTQYQYELKNGPVDPVTGGPQQVVQNDANGEMLVGDDGMPVTAPAPPPSPDTHASLMADKINEIRNQAESDLGGSALRKFRESFEPTANRIQMDTQADAIALMHQSSRGALQDALQKNSDAFVDANDFSKPQIKAQTYKSIDDAVANRTLTPEEGWQMKKLFIHETAFGSARKTLYSSSDGAQKVMDAVRGGEFNELPADQREKIYDMAVNHAYTTAQRQNIQLDHAQKMIDLQEKTQGQAAAKTGNDLWLNGKLTPQWLEANKNILPLANYNALGKALKGGDDAPSDANLKNYLVNEIIGNGGDPIEVMNVAAGVAPGSEGNKQLNSHDYLEFMKMRAEYSNSVKGNPAAKATAERIRQSFGADKLTGTPAQSAAGADAQREFFKFVQANPRATAKDMDDKADELIRRGSIFQGQEMETSMLRPKFLPGNVHMYDPGAKEALDQAAMATVKAHETGQLKDEEFNNEKKRLNSFRKMIPAAGVVQ